MNRHFLKTSFVFISIAVLATSCGKQRDEQGNVTSDAPKYKYFAKFYMGLPGSEKACGCPLSVPVFLTNDDKNNKRLVTVKNTFFLKDDASNVSVDSVDEDVILSIAGEAGSTALVGCNIGNRSDANSCDLRAEQSIVQEVAVLATEPYRAQLMGLGPYVFNSADTCVRLCNPNNPSDACLRLGAQAAPLVTPFKSLLQAAGSKPGSVITHASLLAAYKLPEGVDQCTRGNIDITESTIENSGTNCEISVSDYTNAHLPIDLLTSLPPKLQGQKATLISPLSGTRADNYIEFADSGLAPAFGFKASSSSPSAAEALQALYGGAVRSVTSLNGQVIITTSTGCISSEVK
ncbi:hypothetical protein LZK73_11925 [Neorhizobium galegae]|nr:hypothetical protein LZK73_11925 [Neorhizobium galegae]